jgi:hypothetical protein
MTEHADEYSLRIHLTESPPNWATAGVAALTAKGGVDFVSGDISDRSNQIDIVLHFGEYSDAAFNRSGFGRFGFWFFRFGGTNLPALHAARSAAGANSALETALWAKFADGRVVCLYQSFGYLEPFAIRRSLARSLAKAAHFPARVLMRYRRGDPLALGVVAPSISGSGPLTSYAAQIRSMLQKTWRKLTSFEQWTVVVGQGTEILPTSKPKWLLTPPNDRFWADPFLVERDGRSWVFVEELLHSTFRGHLAVIELLNDGTYRPTKIILSSEKHLSYPFVFEWADDVYMVPESSASRNVVLWKCVRFPDCWTAVATLLPNIRAVDATLVQHGGRWWMFAAVAEDDACLHDELCLYFADSPLGPWEAHAANPVKSDSRNARPAGNLFVADGALYRPAQDCGTEYGKAIILNRIDRLDTEGFSETQIARIDGGWSPGCLRTHTLSRSKTLWAVDELRLVGRLRRLYE